MVSCFAIWFWRNHLKDFESFMYGCLLVKRMDHLETWPNFYEKDITYIL